MSILEKVQRRASKIPKLKDLPFEKILNIWGISPFQFSNEQLETPKKGSFSIESFNDFYHFVNVRHEFLFNRVTQFNLTSYSL